MNKKTSFLATGFALFSMFFGSGNLVFPIAVGQAYPQAIILSSIGIILTGVLVPFLGVYGMSLFHGNSEHFFSCLGKKGTFWFSLLALSLMGPFGVLARCLTVAHGSIQLLIPQASLVTTSFVLCALIYFMTYKKSRIIQTLGQYLTPVLLLAILALAYFGLKHPEHRFCAKQVLSLPAFSFGFLQGYQTMDLLAAFFFSKFIIHHIEDQYRGQEETQRYVLRNASLIGASLLCLVYIIMVALGSYYYSVLAGLPAEEMLAKVALVALGNWAGPILCLAVVMACLTTAIVLASLFAIFTHQEVFNKKVSEKHCLLLTLLIGFLVSTLDFAGIARFLGPVLELVYPSLIVLTLTNIAHKRWSCPLTHWPATLTLLLKLSFF